MNEGNDKNKNGNGLVIERWRDGNGNEKKLKDQLYLSFKLAFKNINSSPLSILSINSYFFAGFSSPEAVYS